MSPAELQQSLFKQVKQRLPAHLSLPEELAALLGISADSAYRRIRGEKPMDLGELSLVCSTYHLSLDALVAQGNGQFVFNGRFVGEADYPFATWLAGMNAQLEQIAHARDAVFIFRAEDIPTFHYFQIPELTHFKLFFWRRTLLDQPDFQKKRFSLADDEPELLAIARKTYLTYAQLPGTEIWNADSLNAFLRQISFYHDTGLFAKEDIEVREQRPAA
ncbi:MAG TPA: helix-turn-helix domain-containing protein, partial [Flavobacteriales bacterium]|nr:helix-turn-helix domain-containing protein [Flavobacteriales bacterium]